ncbi:hypothetical protein Pcinc_015544 [Petrolisthes cinctipes]|uniref:Ionotropic glutamate receptor C-terminal domain-containing protein n=1 Tax=Petrolisthes cinctipes TaxID=88211 RepID=A0AAE1FT30_PETCI|nr:hypothetical protein Pcinc_015544 [Petrolisthes cinctipes]
MLVVSVVWVWVWAVWQVRVEASTHTIHPQKSPQSIKEGVLGVVRTLLKGELAGCTLTFIGGGRRDTDGLLINLATQLTIAYQFIEELLHGRIANSITVKCLNPEKFIVSPGDLDPDHPPDLLWSRSDCDVFLLVIPERYTGKVVEGQDQAMKERRKGEGEGLTKEGLTRYLGNETAPWNYRGRYVFLGTGGGKRMRPLATTLKMTKTEHAIFVSEGESSDIAEVWTHWLYSLHPWRRVARYALQTGLKLQHALFTHKLRDLQGYPLVAKSFAFAPSVFGKLRKVRRHPIERWGAHQWMGDEGEDGHEGEKKGLKKEKQEGQKKDLEKGQKKDLEEGQKEKQEEEGQKDQKEDVEEEEEEGVLELVPEGGQDVRFLQLMAVHMNFTILWRYPGEYLWGDVLENGTYTGAVGQVGRGDGDVSAANIFLDYNRIRYAAYTYPYTYEEACFITPAPLPLHPWSAVVSPFAPLVWAGLFSTIIIVSLFLPALARALVTDKLELPGYYRWDLTLLRVVGTLTCESYPLPRTDRMRVVYLTFQLTMLVVAVSYSGNLTAYLTTKNVEDPIRTIRDLADRGLPVVGYDTYWRNLFTSSLNPYVKSLGPRYIVSFDNMPVFRQIAEDRDRVLVENINHLEYVLKQHYTTRRGEAPIRIQEECLLTFGVSAFLNTNSPLRSYFDEAIHYMQAGGLTDQFFKEVLIKNMKNENYQEEGDTWLDLHDTFSITSNTQVLTLGHMQGPWILLGVGSLGACVAFVIEFCLASCRTHHPTLSHPNSLTRTNSP